MGTQKRDRKKANRQARLESEQRTARRRGLVRRVVFIVVLTLGVLAVALLFNLLAGDDDDVDAGDVAADGTPAADGGTTDPATTGTPGTTEATATGATATEPPPAGDPADCPAEDGTSARQLSFDAPPPLCIDPAADHTAVVETTEGTFTIALDAAAAPQTVNNFVVLSRYQYYDDVAFHRIVPGFVVQGGDPVGQPPGTGGPGYTFPDELPEAGSYELGSVAMANSGPDTNGSQFFIVTGDQGTQLPPHYSLFGSVTEGFEVVQAIEATDPSAEPPRILDVAINQG